MEFVALIRYFAKALNKQSQLLLIVATILSNLISGIHHSHVDVLVASWNTYLNWRLRFLFLVVLAVNRAVSKIFLRIFCDI